MVRVRSDGDLVEEGFVSEGALHAAGRTDPGRPERRGHKPVCDRLDVCERIRDGSACNDAAGTHRSFMRHVGGMPQCSNTFDSAFSAAHLRTTPRAVINLPRYPKNRNHLSVPGGLQR
jgi:hypothetical protein